MTFIIAAAQSASAPGNVSENLARHLRFANIAAHHGARLLVFPELSLTGYEPGIARCNAIHPQDHRLDPMRDLAQEARMTVVVGAPVLNDKQELYIAALAICPDSSVLTYAKQHLHAGEERVFAPGPGGTTLQVEDAIVTLAICADTTRPQHAASAAAQGAKIYAAGVLITENGYAPDAALLRQYALEHKMAVLMANHSGPTGGYISAGRSAIWSERGSLVVASSGTEEALILGREQGGVWEGSVLPVRPFLTIAGSQ